MLRGISKRSVKIGLIALALAICAAITWFILYGPGAWTNNISNRDLHDTTTDARLPRDLNGESAEILSAFHGLDKLPFLANLICRGAGGKTGMPNPPTFSELELLSPFLYLFIIVLIALAPWHEETCPLSCQDFDSNSRVVFLSQMIFIRKETKQSLQFSFLRRVSFFIFLS